MFGKQSVSFVCGLFLGLTVFCATDNAQAANFNNLSFQGNYVEAHPVAINTFAPFIEKTEKDLKNEVTFSYFSNGMLYPESESYAVLNDGRVDIAVVRPALFPNVMDVINVIAIPGIVSNAVIGSLVAAELVEKFPEVAAELPQNSVPFTIWASDTLEIHTSMPIKTLEDLKGKKLIVWDSTTMAIAQKLGANPIRLSPPDSYLSLSKGMADGVMAPIAPVRSFKLSEVTKHHLMLNLGVGIFQMAAFKPLWDEFPPHIQEYFKAEAGKKLSLSVGQSLLAGSVKDIQWLLNGGHEINYITSEEQEKLDALLFSFKEDYVKKVTAKGIGNAEEILKFTEERSAYHQAEFEKGVYGDFSIN